MPLFYILNHSNCLDFFPPNLFLKAWHFRFIVTHFQLVVSVKYIRCIPVVKFVAFVFGLVQEFLALPRADAIHLLGQYNGNAETVIQQLFP